MATKIEIEDIQRLIVKPGDVLIVTVPETEPISAQQAQSIKDLFETLPVRVIVKTSQVQMEVVHEERAS